MGNECVQDLRAALGPETWSSPRFRSIHVHLRFFNCLYETFKHLNKSFSSFCLPRSLIDQLIKAEFLCVFSRVGPGLLWSALCTTLELSLPPLLRSFSHTCDALCCMNSLPAATVYFWPSGSLHGFTLGL